VTISCEYLKSEDNCVHVINAQADALTLTAGILCVIPGAETICRITDGEHLFTVELPAKMLSRSDRVKAFNIELDILSYEQVQFSAGD
jgi:hypothetical protein